jgi:putative membrane protein
MQIFQILTPIRVLFILYIVGIIGVTVPLHENFMLLTPINLLVTFIIAVLADKNKSTVLYIALVICYLCGFVIELLGVQSGLLFGEYSYGGTLGPKIWGTPLIIGINWAMLVYASVSLSNRILPHGKILFKAAIGATFMVALDVLIEPVAIHFDFWNWAAAPINRLIVAPVQNYITWWIAAFLLNIVFQNLVPATKNRVIEVLYYLQCVFFAWILLFVI